MKDKVVILVQGDLYGPPKGKCSKFRFLEIGRPGGIFELYWYKETCTGSDSNKRVSKHEVHEPSIHDEDLPFLTKEVGNYSRILDIFNGSIKDKCVDLENGSALHENALNGTRTSRVCFCFAPLLIFLTCTYLDPHVCVFFFFCASLPSSPPEGCFWSRAHIFKELEFVARSLPRLEHRTFSSLELAS